MDCISYLLQLPTDWQTQKLLLSDSIYNRTAAAEKNTATASTNNQPHREAGQKRPSTASPRPSTTNEKNANAVDKTAAALAYNFDCKFVFLMKSYDVTNYIYTSIELAYGDTTDHFTGRHVLSPRPEGIAGHLDSPGKSALPSGGLMSPISPRLHYRKETNHDDAILSLINNKPLVNKLDIILADPRFRSDSYYIESLGMVAPILVKWVKTNQSYLNKAKSLIPLYRRIGLYIHTFPYCRV